MSKKISIFVINMTKTLKIGQQKTYKVEGFKVNYGTINSKDPKCIYLNLSGYVKPDEGYDLNTEINQFKKHFKVLLRDAVNQLFGKDIDDKMPIILFVNVSDTEQATSFNRVNKTFTYFNIDITLYFNKPINVRDSDVGDKLSLLFYVIFDMLKESRNLSFKPTKK